MTIEAPSASTALAREDERARTTTESPRSTNRRAAPEPMNPVPPVIMTRIERTVSGIGRTM